MFYKKVFLKILQNSEENTCARVPFLKKRLRHRGFPLNFAKFLRTPIFIKHRVAASVDGKLFALLRLNIEMKRVFFLFMTGFFGKRKTSIRILYHFLILASVICMGLCWLLNIDFNFSRFKVWILEFFTKVRYMSCRRKSISFYIIIKKYLFVKD